MSLICLLLLLDIAKLSSCDFISPGSKKGLRSTWPPAAEALLKLSSLCWNTAVVFFFEVCCFFKFMELSKSVNPWLFTWRALTGGCWPNEETKGWTLVSESPINNWITWLLLALLELFMVVTEVA
jgi:hypothetical protein